MEKCKVWVTLILLRNLNWDPSSSRSWIRMIDTRWWMHALALVYFGQ